MTDYGFRWGPMEVTRLAHVEGRGYVLEIRTEHLAMQVYVTEKGRKVEAMPVTASRLVCGTCGSRSLSPYCDNCAIAGSRGEL